MSEHSTLEHFDYVRIDVECTCSICTEWRQTRIEFESMKRLIKNHDRSCFCWKCCRVRELQIHYLAIQSKRDIYCEMSWHASKAPKTGGKLMEWLEKELLTSDETPGWWAKISPCFSLGHWLWKFQVASLSVSGITA